MNIIKSLLDVDFYKYLMGQAIWIRHRDHPVLFAFKCRTPCIALSKLITPGVLRQELNQARSLSLTQDELNYLRQLTIKGQKIFREDYLQWLKDLRLPEFYLEVVEDTFKLEFEGPWATTTFWETISLSIISELFWSGVISSWGCDPGHLYATGEMFLTDKIKAIQGYPGLRFSDFGTRRRFKRDWQEAVLEELITELKDGQLIGTSNVMFAKQFGIRPIGTMAHEMFMGSEGILRADSIDHDTLKDVNSYVMDWWEEIYPYHLRINLPDTYGSDFALSQMTEERMRNWKGERQDSGDTVSFAEKRIAKYKEFGIDPREKTILFSDGLELDTMLALYEHFTEKVDVSFGWGTNLMNHFIYNPISIVTKLVRSGDFWVVKLSDNLAKATGREDDIEAAKVSLGYVEGLHELVKY